jgi:polar amino acid transport system ATP-binding protein
VRGAPSAGTTSGNGAGDAVLRVRALHKSYPDHGAVLRGIDLEVRAGELVALIGRSGCGKSTLLRCLNGLEPFDSGAIAIAGVDLVRPACDALDENELAARAHAVRRRVGMVFQQFNLFPHLSVLENVAKAPIVVRGLARAAALEGARALLDKVGLGALVDRRPTTLSGGQQQRAAIARALAMEPDVMLYDEPTSSLDPELVEEVLDVMRALDGEGMTQLVVTHELRFARDAADVVAFLDAGEIVERGSPAQLFGAPRDERTRQYVRRLL